MTKPSVEKPSGLLKMLNPIVDAWTRYRRRSAAIAELGALGDAELERVVHDAGLTVGDLLALIKQGDDSASLLYGRLKEAGIDFKTIEPLVMRDMERSCSMCTAKVQCAHELEDAPKAASWPDYCPNRQTIEALATARCH